MTERQIVALPERPTLRNLYLLLFDRPKPLGHDLVLDLSACEWIELPVVLYLTSILSARIAQERLTTLALPTKPQTLSFLRAWNFDGAIEESTGRRFTEFLSTSEDRLRWKGTPGVDPAYIRTIVTDRGQERILPNDFYWIRTLRAADLNPERETRVWTTTLVQKVLRRHFGGDMEWFPSYVVYEALANSLRHPGASLVQTSCQHDTPDRGSAAFYLCFWDNGVGIADTLASALAKGINIRSFSPTIYERTFYIEMTNRGLRRTARPRISSLSTVDVGADEYEFLLAALFPGITSDPDSPRVSVVTREAGLIDVDRPGMGLFLLTHSVVERLRGEVTLISGNCLIEVQRRRGASGETLGYNTTVTIARNQVEDFRGNLLSLKVPSVEGQQSSASDAVF